MEKFSKVNDAIALKKNVNLVQFKLTESDRSISFHPTTAFLALSLLDLTSNSPDCLQSHLGYEIFNVDFSKYSEHLFKLIATGRFLRSS